MRIVMKLGFSDRQCLYLITLMNIEAKEKVVLEFLLLSMCSVELFFFECALSALMFALSFQSWCFRGAIIAKVIADINCAFTVAATQQ